MFDYNIVLTFDRNFKIMKGEPIMKKILVSICLILGVLVELYIFSACHFKGRSIPSSQNTMDESSTAVNDDYTMISFKLVHSESLVQNNFPDIRQYFSLYPSVIIVKNTQLLTFDDLEKLLDPLNCGVSSPSIDPQNTDYTCLFHCGDKYWCYSYVTNNEKNKNLSDDEIIDQLKPELIMWIEELQKTYAFSLTK